MSAVYELEGGGTACDQLPEEFAMSTGIMYDEPDIQPVLVHDEHGGASTIVVPENYSVPVADSGMRQRTNFIHPYGLATLKPSSNSQRVHVVQMTPPPVPIIQRVRRWIYSWYTGYLVRKEVFWLHVDEKYEPAMRKCQSTTRNVLLVAIAVVIVMGLYGLIQLYFTDEQVVIEAQKVFARHPQTDFSRTSRPIECMELQTRAFLDDISYTQAITFAENVLQNDEDALCTCAPMFGLFVRHIAFTLDSKGTAIIHAFNPELVTNDDIGRRKVYVTENQRNLFPDRKTSVKNVRFASVALQYTNADEQCSRSQIVFHNASAYCIQACIDLLKGISVYDTR